MIKIVNYRGLVYSLVSPHKLISQQELQNEIWALRFKNTEIPTTTKGEDYNLYDITEYHDTRVFRHYVADFLDYHNITYNAISLLVNIKEIDIEAFVFGRKLLNKTKFEKLIAIIKTFGYCITQEQFEFWLKRYVEESAIDETDNS